ncbi:uncharacterized protein LOC127079729 [Lathyrus oleraceus]|uniref:uncharacterized protein LOC127079729 n=1 Tax=Pisum sativum TaxID=3888 RepID=UPI0021CE8ED8|nr:uncharacterized protein LOC127079729 [Pisum sativum]
MKKNVKVPDYISRVILITNEMKSCEETLYEQVIIEKNSLEAQKLCLIERNSEREVKQTLKASSGKKNQKQSWLEANKRHDDGYQKSKASNSNEKKHHKRKEKFNKKKERKPEEENITRGYFDDENVLLMVSESNGGYLVDWWYMDIGFSNNLTGNKKWIIDFDSRKRTKIIYVDDKYLNTEGMGNLKVRVKHGKTVLIKDVWYVPSMKSNLMSVRQLIEKGFSITMKDNLLKLYDSD